MEGKGKKEKGNGYLMKSRSYRDLDVWKLAMEISLIVYRVTRGFPSDERFGITSQMRRSATSMAANIAEGWGRGTKGHLANFAMIARGSATELETFVEIAYQLEFLNLEDYQLLTERLSMFGKKSYQFLASIKPDSVREDNAPYGE